jgi:hypothetical protein
VSTDDTAKQVPTMEEVGQARAYLAGVAHGFGLLMEDWIGIGDGTALTTDEEKTTLLYTGDELHPFDALIPCNVHRRHRVGVTWPAQLDKVRASFAECSANAPAPADTTPAETDAPAETVEVAEMSDHPADPPTVTLRPVSQPSPLWLITAAAETPGTDRQRPAAS